MALNELAQGSPRTDSQSSFFIRGTSPLNAWYAGIQNQTAFGVAAPAINLIRAFPFTLSRSATLSKISFELTTSGGAGSKFRVGIYKNTSPTVMYPSSLLVDGGEKDTTVAASVQATSGLAIDMPAGIYWFAWLPGTSAPTVRTIGLGGQVHALGALNTLATLNSFLSVGLAYQSLPSSFPAGAALASGATVLTALEFA